MVTFNYLLCKFPYYCAVSVSTFLRSSCLPNHPTDECASVYVGLPNIAQKGVDDTSLKFFELQFLNPTKGTVDITQTAELHSPSIFTPTLDPFTAGLWLVTDGQYGPSPFATIGFPSIHAMQGNSNVSFSGQTIPILDVDQLSEYAIQVLSQETVTTALTGKTILHVGALPTVEINYNSSTTYKALNGLKGFNTTDLRIDFAAKEGEPNLIGNAFIPNPSVMTIEMVSFYILPILSVRS